MSNAQGYSSHPGGLPTMQESFPESYAPLDHSHLDDPQTTPLIGVLDNDQTPTTMD